MPHKTKITVVRLTPAEHKRYSELAPFVFKGIYGRTSLSRVIRKALEEFYERNMPTAAKEIHSKRIAHGRGGHA